MKYFAFAMVFLIGFLALTSPVRAAPYETTFTLKEKGKTYWTTQLLIETTTGNVTIIIPSGLYDILETWFSTNIFHTPINILLPLNNSTLEVTSTPGELTIIFQSMQPGDVNGDKYVDIFDLVLVVQFFGQYNLFYDLYFDSTFIIDVYDLIIIAMNFGNRY